MTKIHMETDLVRSFADQYGRNMNTIQDIVGDLYRGVQSLAWDGESSRGYRRDFLSLKKQIEEMCDQGRTLSTRVQREVDEWLEMDQGGAKRINPDPGFWGRLHEGIEDLRRRIFFPYTMQEGLDTLFSTDAGKALLADLINSHVQIQVVGDGTYGYMGDDAKVITLTTGQSIGGGQYSPRDSTITVPDDLLNRLARSPKDLAEVIGHEMQHAMDDKTNTYVGASTESDLKNYANLTPEQQKIVSQNLAKDFENINVDTEIRAYERGSSISSGQPYNDDGVNTGAERQAVLDRQLDISQTYEDYYEKAMATQFPGLSFDFYVDANGELQVNIASVKSS